MNEVQNDLSEDKTGHFLPVLIPTAAVLLRRTQTAMGLLHDVVQESLAEYWYERSKKWRTEGVDASIFFCTYAIEANSNHYRALNMRGFLKYSISRCYEAIFDFDQAIEIAPDYINSYIMRGKSKYIIEDYQGALQDFNRVIELDPLGTMHMIHETYFDRQDVKVKLGDITGAKIDQGKARELCGLPRLP